MKAISIKQPWTFTVLNGLKDVENRTWRPPDSVIGQRVVVHAGKQPDKQVAAWGATRWILSFGVPEADAYHLTWATHPLGALIGEVTITGYVEESDSPWFFGPYGWTLEDPIVYSKPIPYKGQLGFFDIPDDVLADATPMPSCATPPPWDSERPGGPRFEVVKDLAQVGAP